MSTTQQGDKNEESTIVLDGSHQTIANKKIYFDPEGAEVKVGYDQTTGVGFVEIISE